MFPPSGNIDMEQKEGTENRQKMKTLNKGKWFQKDKVRVGYKDLASVKHKLYNDDL